MGFFKTLHKKYDQIKNEEKNHYVAAVIVAAGKSRRMQSENTAVHEIDKQLIQLCEIPVIARTISAFEECHTVDEIVVVTNSENIVIIADIIKEFGFEKVKRIIRGGTTRQFSAFEGLKCISENSDYIVIHDGARPLISPYAIDKTVAAAFEKNAAAAAVKVKDTIKLADDNGIIIATPQRANLWAVQTPQVFNVALYRKAFEKALQENADYTDDCQLIESYGCQVQLVECEYTNIKITTKDDIFFAESLIRARSDSF